MDIGHLSATVPDIGNISATDNQALMWSRRVSGGAYLRGQAILETCPPLLADALAERYLGISGAVRTWFLRDGRVADSWNEADDDLRRLGNELRAVRPDRAFDDDAIEAAADRAARFCMTLTNLAAAVDYAEAQGVMLPRGPRVTPSSLRRRLRSPDYWRRRLRTVFTRKCEELFRRLGFVRAQSSAYVSGDALERIRAAQLKTRHWLSETSAVCQETGETMPLAQIAEHSLANPPLRRGELMLRARGFQETADAAGHRCLMVTLTAPSAFHAWLRESGERNPHYNGTTPRDAQQWLNQHWARARAALKRRGLLYYGFRVAEPHHDGTPHWHMILYAPPECLETLQVILRKIWLKDFSHESGATTYRVKFTVEDSAKGSGVAYLAKYIAKNIDGHGSVGQDDSDESNRPISDDAQHAVAWARLHGIRQFQQLGGPAVTLWRELRRVREPCEWAPLEALRLCTTRSVPGPSQGNAVVRYASETVPGGPTARPELSGGGADSSTGPSWARFVAELGGIADSLRASRALFDKMEPRCIDSAGRKVMRMTRWGELPAPMIVGLQVVWHDRIRRLATRFHVWFLIFTPRSGSPYPLGPVAITVLGAATLNEPAGWTNPQETSQAPPARADS